MFLGNLEFSFQESQKLGLTNFLSCNSSFPQAPYLLEKSVGRDHFPQLQSKWNSDVV